MTNADCSSADIRTAFLAIARILLASLYYIDNFERPYLSQFSKFWKNSLNTSNLCGIMNKSLNYNFMIGFFNFTYFQKFNIFCSDFADEQLRRACARPKTPAQSRWPMPSRVNIFRQKRRRFWNWVAQSAFLIIGSLGKLGSSEKGCEKSVLIIALNNTFYSGKQTNQSWISNLALF